MSQINKLCVKALSIVSSDCQPKAKNITPPDISESFSCWFFVFSLWAGIGTPLNSNQNPWKLRWTLDKTFSDRIKDR